MNKLFSLSKVMFLLIILLLTLTPNIAAAQTPVRVGVSCHFPPYQFLDNDGKLKGLHIDIMESIAISQGLNIEYVAYEKKSQCLQALKNGDIDAILGFKSNDPAANKFQSTGDISTASLCMMSKNILNGQYPYRYDVAFEFGTVSYSLMLRINATSFSIEDSQESLFEALISGRVRTAVGIKESMAYQLEQSGQSDNYTTAQNYLASIGYSILVRQSDSTLFKSLDQGLMHLRASGEYESFIGKWIVNNDLLQAQIKFKWLLQATIIALCSAAVFMGVIYWTNRRLKHMVSEKTQALFAANTELHLRMQQIEKEGFLRNSLIEYSPSGVVFFDSQGNVLLMNPSAMSLANINELPKGKNIKDINVFGDLWEHISSIGPSCDTQPAIIISGSKSAAKNKYRCQYHWLPENQITIFTAEDVTSEELKKLEMFETEKNSSLNRIIAGIAHEIKNPLMSIRAFASLLLKNGDNAEFQASFAQFVPKEVDRINKLIESLINYARPVKGIREHLILDELINDCLYLAHVTAKKDYISFEVDIPKGVVVYANKDQLRQALINFIMNGIESMEQKISRCTDVPLPTLVMRVSAQYCNNMLCIDIHDDGVGMAELDIQRCLEPFYTTKSNGTGLGMPLANQFIQENSGHLDITSIKNKYTNIRIIFSPK